MAAAKRVSPEEIVALWACAPAAVTMRLRDAEKHGRLWMGHSVDGSARACSRFPLQRPGSSGKQSACTYLRDPINGLTSKVGVEALLAGWAPMMMTVLGEAPSCCLGYFDGVRRSAPICQTYPRAGRQSSLHFDRRGGVASLRTAWPGQGTSLSERVRSRRFRWLLGAWRPSRPGCPRPARTAVSGSPAR